MRLARGTAWILAGALAVAGCGGGDPQSADEPEGEYKLDIVSASFPEDQTLAQPSKMKIVVRNAETERTVPHIAVTIKTAPENDENAPQAFAQRVDDPQLADPSRPIWIVDESPEGATVAHTNTWALPRIAPGETVEFEWAVTAVKAGDYTIDYEVFPGLDGQAVLAEDGGRTEGSFAVSIEDAPPEARVNDDGEVVREY